MIYNVCKADLHRKAFLSEEGGTAKLYRKEQMSAKQMYKSGVVTTPLFNI